MALDEQLFEEFIQNPSASPILRIFRVKPGVSVGHSACSQREDACVRPTGGGRIRHGNDLIYSVIARYDSFVTFGRVRMSYLSFHEVIQEAFRKLGIETELFRCDDPKVRRNPQSHSLGDCFDRPVPTDVGIGGRKIAGAAQRRKQNAFLHQGSIQLPNGVSYEDLKEKFIQTFEKKFGVVWECIEAIN